MHQVNYFAFTNFRNQKALFGIRYRDRYQHCLLIGKSGSGKTTTLQTIALQDISRGHSVCFIDPHGDAVKSIYSRIPQERKKDVIFLDFTNPDLIWGYNPLRKVPVELRSLVASSILHILKKFWQSAWGLKIEHLIRMCLLLLLDQETANFKDINRLLLEEEYRIECIVNCTNNHVTEFWEKEFPLLKSNDILPVLSKTGGFLSHPIIRKVLIENPKRLSIRYAIDNKKIILMSLAKGAIGSDVANILGSLFVNSLSSSGFSRIDTPEELRKPCHIFLDEYHDIVNPDLLSEMLSSLRKFRLSLCLANQFLHQLDDRVKNAILGNVGTLIAFRLGVHDANLLAQEFFPVFSPIDFINLPNSSVLLRLMIDGRPSKPFSADTIKYYPP